MKQTIVKTNIQETTWPDLLLAEWEDTYNSLQLMMQMVGKIKLEYTSPVNHWWNATFYPCSSGLTTGLIPYKNISFEMEFDFASHLLKIKCSDGRKKKISLAPVSIAEFYAELKETMQSLSIDIHIWPVPVEIDDRLPFDQDLRSRKYDPDYVHRFWNCLLQVNKIMNRFRTGFEGKASPVHFFWGSLDLALTFFSGRPAPEHPGGPNVSRKVMIEAYKSELASFGFWGGKGLGEAAFYAYAYPEPAGFKGRKILPPEAYYNETFGEFILPYSAVQKSLNPEQMVFDFYRNTFRLSEELASWETKYKDEK